MKKTIKAFAIMNKDESNGYYGILWHSQGNKVLPLCIYSSKMEAEEFKKRASPFSYKRKEKIVEVEIKIINNKNAKNQTN